MPFVNEYIPADDFEKYQLREIDKHHVVGGTNARDWTIDRERGIYLRNIANGREEYSFETIWTFYWSSRDYTLMLHSAGFSGKPGGPGQMRWGLVRVNGREVPDGIPEPQEEFLRDLEAALVAYKDGGVFAQCTEFTVELVPGLERNP